jgi:hypothetical protein
VADWTVVINDMLVEWPRACLRCGTRARWLTVREVGGTAWLGSLCDACYGTHGWAAVDRVLRQRAQGL